MRIEALAGLLRRLLALLLCVLLIGSTMDAAAFADGEDSDDNAAPAGDGAHDVPSVDDEGDDTDAPAEGDAPASPERGGSEQGEAEGFVPSDDADDGAPASPERGGAEQGEAEGSASSDVDTDAPDDGDAPASPERGGAEQGEAEGSASSAGDDAFVGDDAPGVPPADDESAEKTVVYRFTVDGATVAEQTVKDGDTLDKPADPVKEGYTFLGWFIGETQLFVTDADSDGVIDPETVSVTEDSEDVTVTAAFEKIDATPSNAAASAGDDAPGVLPADADDGAPASPERGGAEQGEAKGSVSPDPDEDDDPAADDLDGEGGPKRGAKKAPNGSSVVASGNCGANGDNLSWKLYSDGELVISGSGAMADYPGFVSPWYQYHDRITGVAIDSTVSSIGGGAFSGCSALTSIAIPDRVRSIGDWAFEGCTGLTSITIPAGVESIGDWAFGGCSSLTSIGDSDFEWLSDLISIGDYAFCDCSSLASFPLPLNLRSIGGGAFSGCSALTSITIPDYVTVISSNVFSGCSMLESVTIPEDVTSIGDNAFCGCSKLSSISIPESVTSIGGYAFYGCSKFSSVSIPEGVTSIGAKAFYNCSGLTSVTIPASLRSIGDSAFSWCGSLTSITIPLGLSSIGECAFEVCRKMESIWIPSSVTSIGERAFSDCTGLRNVYYGGSEAEWQELYGSVPNNAEMHYGIEVDPTVLASGTCGLLGESHDNAHWTLYKNGEMVISGYNEMQAYDDDRLFPPWYDNRDLITEVTIESGITSIGNYSFYGCSRMTTVRIPSTVASIGVHAFSGCSALTGVTIPEGVAGIGKYAFQRCTSLKSMTIPGSTESVSSYLFAKCSALESVIIEPGVLSIETEAFSECYSLSCITIPDTVTSIGPSVLNSSPLQDIYYGGSEAEWYALYNDTQPDIATIHFNSVLAKPTITKQPESKSVKEGDTASFTVEATCAETYQWQYRSSSSGSWANATAEGNKTATLKVPATTGRNGYQYRCAVKNANGTTYSNAATLTVKPKPVITAQPKSVSVKEDGTATFTVSATGATSWQWQYRTSSSGSWASATAEGNKTATLKVPATSGRNGYQYRCKLTIANGSTWSSAATLTVLQKPKITAQPASVSVKEGGTATFTVEATGVTGWQWQYRSSDSGAWANATAEGNKTATLKVPATSGRNGYQYRCKLTNANGSSWSSAATLTVKLKPKITAPPSSVSVKEGGTAAFTVEATGAASYQWQYRSSGGSWLNSSAEGNKTATLKVPATSGRNGYQYRCKLTNANGSSWSSAATLTVKLKPVITAQPVSVTANRGETATFTVEATGATSYQWRFRSSSEGSWYNATAEGCRTATLKVPATAGRDGYQYCCILKNDNGTRYTAFVTLTVR